jgi:hypothetical protein
MEEKTTNDKIRVNIYSKGEERKIGLWWFFIFIVGRWG